jgi:hypothetical protein
MRVPWFGYDPRLLDRGGVVSITATGSGIRDTLDDVADRVRSSHLVRMAVRAAGAVAAAALTAGVGIGLAAIPVAGPVLVGVMGTTAAGAGGIAAGALFSRHLPQERGSGSTGLRRLAITAAVGGVAGVAAGIAGFIAAPLLTAALTAGLLAQLEASVAGGVAAGIAWDRLRDVPVDRGRGLDG